MKFILNYKDSKKAKWGDVHNTEDAFVQGIQYGETPEQQMDLLIRAVGKMLANMHPAAQVDVMSDLGYKVYRP